MTDGYWEDIGTLEAYARAHQDILDGRVTSSCTVSALRNGIWLGEGAEVDPRAEIRGAAMIGDYCKVESGATLGRVHGARAQRAGRRRRLSGARRRAR